MWYCCIVPFAHQDDHLESDLASSWPSGFGTAYTMLAGSFDVATAQLILQALFIWCFIPHKLVAVFFQLHYYFVSNASNTFDIEDQEIDLHFKFVHCKCLSTVSAILCPPLCFFSVPVKEYLSSFCGPRKKIGKKVLQASLACSCSPVVYLFLSFFVIKIVFFLLQCCMHTVNKISVQVSRYGFTFL